MLAEELLEQGEILIKGKSIDDFILKSELMTNIVGYCPQINPIIDELTVQESLAFFAQLKGLTYEKSKSFSEEYAKVFQIHPFFDTRATNLSGGNKRKLCTAIAMIGNPEIIFLDESSAGVDPYVRRLLWKTIRNQSKNSALIVTTHNMEEAEALGTKIAIMVSGKFKCFGSTQQIKQKHGGGFTLQIIFDYPQILKRNQLFIKAINAEIDKFAIQRSFNLNESSYCQTTFEINT